MEREGATEVFPAQATQIQHCPHVVVSTDHRCTMQPSLPTVSEHPLILVLLVPSWLGLGWSTRTATVVDKTVLRHQACSSLSITFHETDRKAGPAIYCGAHN